MSKRTNRGIFCGKKFLSFGGSYKDLIEKGVGGVEEPLAATVNGNPNHKFTVM